MIEIKLNNYEIIWILEPIRNAASNKFSFLLKLFNIGFTNDRLVENLFNFVSIAFYFIDQLMNN